MTDEARDAFTIEVVDSEEEEWQYVLHLCKEGPYLKAWLYDARIALERLGYRFEPDDDAYIWWNEARAVTFSAETCEAAIEAAVQHYTRSMLEEALRRLEQR